MTIDIVNAELSSSEEQNVTESAKTYKVNCDKRNITEMDNIAVQVLNSSQVIRFIPHSNNVTFMSKTQQSCYFSSSPFLKASYLQIISFQGQEKETEVYICVCLFTQDLMEFLNANSTECSVVLFFTAWCQFSARLAPHFNALPRTFPGMHFLALDASQHSR